MSRGHSGGQHQNQYQCQNHDHHQKPAPEMSREELDKQVDKDFACIGMVVADICKTLTTAMVSLPNMELHTRQLCVSVGDDGISASIHLNHEGGCDDYDEEGHIYDGD